MPNQEFATALHILTILAYTRELESSEGIAESVQTNAAVIRKFIRLLAAAGLVDTVRGATGGVRLARPANRITLAEVYRALKPTPLVAKRSAKGDATCPVGCRMDAIVGALSQDVEEQLDATLGKQTLATIVRQIPPTRGSA